MPELSRTDVLELLRLMPTGTEYSRLAAHDAVQRARLRSAENSVDILCGRVAALERALLTAAQSMEHVKGVLSETPGPEAAKRLRFWVGCRVQSACEALGVTSARSTNNEESSR